MNLNDVNVPLLLFILQPHLPVLFAGPASPEDTDPQFQQAAAGVVRQLAQDAAQSEADAGSAQTRWIRSFTLW